MAAVAALAPIFQAVAPIFGSLLSGGGGMPSMPQQQVMPQAPAPAPAPQAPEVVSEASAEPVTDTEAARVRAQKRRASNADKSLFKLGSEDETTTLSKSLLGE